MPRIEYTSEITLLDVKTHQVINRYQSKVPLAGIVFDAKERPLRDGALKPWRASTPSFMRSQSQTSLRPMAWVSWAKSIAAMIISHCRFALSLQFFAVPEPNFGCCQYLIVTKWELPDVCSH